MKTTNVVYVKGANKTYPQWHNINAELTEKFHIFHAELRSLGYEIKACNIAVKNNEMFWILLCENGWYELEHYATILN
jgi:hypothetical protein